MDPARFVFLDETGTATNMARRYGRSPSHRRLIAAIPHGHWRTTTFIAGLRQTGVIAPLCSTARSPGAPSRLVAQFLVAGGRARDVLVLDNLSAHQALASVSGYRRRPSIL